MRLADSMSFRILLPWFPPNLIKKPFLPHRHWLPVETNFSFPSSRLSNPYFRADFVSSLGNLRRNGESYDVSRDEPTIARDEPAIEVFGPQNVSSGLPAGKQHGSSSSEPEQSRFLHNPFFPPPREGGREKDASRCHDGT